MTDSAELDHMSFYVLCAGASSLQMFFFFGKVWLLLVDNATP